MQGASNRYVTAEMMMMLNLPYKYKENQGFTMKENNVDNLVIQLKGVWMLLIRVGPAWDCGPSPAVAWR